MMAIRFAGFATIAAIALLGAAPAAAQSLKVGGVSATKSCKLYMNSAGRVGAVADPWSVGVFASWRTWWQKECVANFATMRSTLESALAASESVRVGTRSGRYSVFVNITNVGDPNVGAPEAPSGGNMGIARSFVSVSMDVQVRDAAGHVVFGGLLTRRMEIGSDIKVDGFQTTNVQAGPAAYGRLQNELALAAARMVSFHFAPIQVTATQGRDVQLNYGGPLLHLGALLLISSPDRATTVRYRVTQALDGFSTATPDARGNPASIGPGSVATYIDADDPQQNARRFERVDLP